MGEKCVQEALALLEEHGRVPLNERWLRENGIGGAKPRHWLRKVRAALPHDVTERENVLYWR